MKPIPLSRDDALGLLDDIDIRGRCVTQWEADFVDALLKHLEAGGDLTAGQERMLRDIHRERVR